MCVELITNSWTESNTSFLPKHVPTQIQFLQIFVLLEKGNNTSIKQLLGNYHIAKLIRQLAKWLVHKSNCVDPAHAHWADCRSIVIQYVLLNFIFFTQIWRTSMASANILASRSPNSFPDRSIFRRHTLLANIFVIWNAPTWPNLLSANICKTVNLFLL